MKKKLLFFLLIISTLIVIINCFIYRKEIVQFLNYRLYRYVSEEEENARNELIAVIQELKEDFENKNETLTKEMLAKINNKFIDVESTEQFPIMINCREYKYEVDTNFEVRYAGERNNTIVNYYSDDDNYTNNQLIKLVIEVSDIEGIEQISYPDDLIIYPHGKKKVFIDYGIENNGAYEFEITNSKGVKRKKEIFIDKIDIEPPKDFDFQYEIEKRVLTIDVHAEDCEKSESTTISGIDRYEYYIKNELSSNYNQLEINKTEKLATGIYDVYVAVYDRAGNRKDSEIKKIEIINTAPSIPKITAYPQTEGNVIKKGRSLTLTCDGSVDDQGDEFEYIWEGRIDEISNAYTVGAHTARVKAVDTDGAESEWAVYNFSVINATYANIELYNATAANFDVRAISGSVRTTYSNGGYTSVIKVGGSQANLSSTTGTINNVTFVRKTELNSQMNYIKTTYTVTNNSGTAQTIGIAVHADIMIGSNDKAPIYANNTGFRMTDGTYTFYVYLKNMIGVDNVDTIWYGNYSSRTSNLWNSTSAASCTGIDSGMAFSWNNRVIQPGETKTYSFIFDVE